MKCCLRVRIVVLTALLSSIGLWLSGGETRATEANQRSSRLLGRSAGNVFDNSPKAGADVSWATVFDYRRLDWSFAPKAAVIPMASITVTTTADTIDAAANCTAVTLASLPGPGGQTSLREAICAANNNSGADTITFSVNGTFALTGAANEDNGGAGDFDIKQSLTIQGNGATNTILDGSGTERIFDVFPSGAITFDLSNLTIQNGDTRTTSFKEGGAMYLHNNVTSTFNNIQVINNFSASNGAIENRGNLTINNSVISNNQTIPASGSVTGGGIHNAGTLTIDNTTISNNTVRGEGGGIATTTGPGVTVTITDSTISGNTASVTGGGNGNGGGISTTGNQGTINITNCTISGNRADNNGGGAAFVSVSGGAVVLTNVTITNNTADNDNNNTGAGGGFTQGSSTTVTLRNTIVAGNFNSTAATRDDISGAIVASSSFNLIGDGTGMSGISNGTNNNQIGSGGSPINPLLGPLVNNGGSTETHALLTGSPAINTANNATAPATDQRGVSRPFGAAADIGAYEVSDSTPPDTTITGNPTNPSNSTSATFTFTGSDNVTPSGSLTFQCQIDGGGYSACTSPRNYTGLASGSHTFQVRAIDQANNTDPTPASYTWTVDATAPDTTITANPTNPSASANASFSFTGSDPGGSGVASFQCQIDGGGFSSCTSPRTYTGLSNGSHTFQVRAIDQAGNTDPTPASYTWTIDTTAPTVTINQATGQSDPTASSPILFTAVFSEAVTGFNIAADVSLSGTAGATTVSITPVNATTYTVSVSGMTGPGTVIATIPSNAAADGAGNGNTASTSTDNTVSYLICPSFPATIAAGDVSGLVTAVACASINGAGTNDVINLTNSTFTFSDDFNDSQTALSPVAAAATAGTLTINGNGATLARSSAGGTPLFRFFLVNSGADLTLNNLTLSNGRVEGAPNPLGGAVHNFGTLRINNSNLSGNYGQNAGGAVANENGTAVLSVTDSTFFNNTSPNAAGAIYNNNGAVATIIRSTFSGNSATGLGSGGAIYNEFSTVTIINSTLSGNSATGGLGGGAIIANGGSVTLTNSTVTGNSMTRNGNANTGGGGLQTANSATITLNNTIVIGNSATLDGVATPARGNCAGLAPGIPGTYTGNYSLTQAGTGCPETGTNITAASAAAVLNTTLGNNGGPTQTHALIAGSPAFNAGSNALAVDAGSQPLTTDQRGTGFPRQIGSQVDIGAYEFNDDTTPPTVISIGLTDTSLKIGDTAVVTFTFSEAVTGFTNADLTVENAMLSSVSSSDGGVTWTATLTPNLGIEDNANIITLDKTGIQDLAGNPGVGTATSPNYSIDTVRPFSTSFSIGDLTLTIGETAIVTIVFNEPITGFDNADLAPDIGTISGLSSSDGGRTWRGTYTPPPSVENPNVNFRVYYDSASGVMDLAGNAGAGGNLYGSIVVDTLAPVVTSVSSTTANGNYKLNDVISVQIVFSEAVSVTGMPRLTLETGTIDRVANYASGSGTNTLTFNYTVQAGDTSADLDYVSTGALALNGGTIKDTRGNNAVLTLPPPGAAGSLGANKNLVIDTVAPDTTITANPTNPSASANASFSFTGSDPGGSGVAGFECQLDGGAFIACTSPQTYTGLSDGSHTFQVRAVDAAGNVDGTPASFTWTVDTTAPDTTITANPTNPSASANASFSFTGNDGSGSGVTSFQCQLDGGGFSTCTSPQTYTGLSQGSHTFQVRAIDAVGNADTTPASYTWVIDTVAPDTTITANPTNPSASANASFSFTGSDPGGSGVAGFECQLDGGAFIACTSPQTYTGLSDGSHTFRVRAVDAAGNLDGTPASFTWVVDATPPDTTITANPSNPSNSVNASFSFTGSDGGGTGVASFQCQLDGGGFSACTSPKTYTGLSEGSHTFQVRAVDAVGNTDPTPASFTWVVDTIAPDTTITANPANPSASANASFSFTGSDPGGSGVASFECKLDGGAFSACTSPKTYTGVSDGSHTFQVRAVDAAGNIDSTPASFTWVIDATPPDTTITGNPPNPSSSTSATFTFTGNDGGGTGVAGFECKLDGGSFVACTSPQTYTGLSLGSHTFQVRAIDAVGNLDPTPASYTWSLNSPPVITPTNLSRAAGTTTANLTIANANDTEDAEDQLRVQISTDGTNFFDTISAGNVTVTLVDQNANVANVNPNTAGDVTATIVTPCNSVTGPLNLFLRVTDTAGQTDTKPWTLTITPNSPPVLSYNATTVVAATTPIISPASGPSDNGTFTIGSVSVSPNNGGLVVALNQSNGVVTVLSALLIGNYTVTVPITDNCNAITNAQLAVTVVCPTITINPASLPNATVNTAYPQTISASPAGGNYSFAVTSGVLPAGLTLNSNGSFSGAPTVSGSFNFRVTATGFGGCTAFRDYVLLVNCAGLTVNPASLPGGTVGTPYNQSVSAAPAGSYSYAVTSGTLPTGLTLNAATGAITGTPTTTGTFNFTITATAGSCTGTQSYTVAVTCAGVSFTTTSPLPAAEAGVAYSQTLNVTPTGSYTFSLTAGNLPGGLTLNPATGVISDTPTVTGTNTFTVKAQGTGGCQASATFTLTTNCPTVTVNPATLPNGTRGTAYSQTVSASPAGGNYTFAVTAGSLPTGLNLNPTTGLLSGSPTVNGSFTFTVTATGFGGCTGSRAYTVVIGGGGCPTISLPGSLPNGAVGQLYTASAAATPAGSYGYTVTGTLPPGVTLYADLGLLFGYPTAAGSYTFSITATQGACTATQSYTVIVSAGFASSLTVFSDFDGDGKSDLSVLRGTDGAWLVANSGDGQTQATPWGSSAAPYLDLTVSGDYDGDGKTDLAVFRRGTDLAGYWFIKQSSDDEINAYLWGLPTDVPVPGDYDGDGKTDVAVWRGSAGAWYVLRSSDGGISGYLWGTVSAGDVPAPGDYDGDFKTDVAVFRRSTGEWHIRRSSDGETVSLKWGQGSDVAVPGDYDGDGKTDVAVWRASEGNWYILESGSAALQTMTLGAAGDVPVAGDFDGDGKADAAIWQASSGTWKIKRSSDGAEVSKNHGQTGDMPVAARRTP